MRINIIFSSSSSSKLLKLKIKKYTFRLLFNLKVVYLNYMQNYTFINLGPSTLEKVH